MKVSPLQFEIEKAITVLSTLAKQPTSLSPKCQEQAAQEINLFLNSLNQLTSNNPQSSPPEKLILQTKENDDRPNLSNSLENRIGRILQGARAGIWELDLVKNTVIWSPELCDLLGIGPGESGSMEAFLAMIHPEDRQIYQERFQSSINKGGYFYQEFRIIRPDKKVIWISSAGYVSYARDGRPLSVTGINQDITERKQAEEVSLVESNQALEKSKNMFFRAFQSSPVAMTITRLSDGQYIDVNDSLCQWIGYTRAEIIGQTILALNIFHNAEERTSFLKLFYEQGSIRNFERTICNRLGEQMTALLSVEPIEVGGESCLLTTMIDITERKRVEVALEKSESRFRAMADGTPLIIWVHNAAGELEFFNRAYTEFTGMSIEQVKSDGWKILIHPEDTANYVDVFIQCSGERRPFHAQARARRKDGQWRWIDSYGQPRFSSMGEFLGMVGSSLDISEQKQAEEALRESEERYRQLVELYPDLVFIQSSGQFTFVNQMGLRVLGAESLDQVVGKPVMDFIHPADRETVRERIQVLNEQRQGVTPLEERYIRLDGTTADLVVVAVPFNDHGQPGALVVARDITDQKRLAAEKKQSEKQIEIQRQLNEYREKERQEIARNIHDGPIQTLAGLLFDIKLVREGIPDPAIQVEFAQLTRSLQGAVRELREVVNGLRPPSLIQFGLSKAIQMYVEDFREKVPELDIQTDLMDDRHQVPEEIRLALFRICQEALNNIIRHANATKVWIRFSIQDGEIALEIQDNGIGMPADTDFVYQTHNGHYGLAGMQERAEALGGRFTLISTPGEGTTIGVRVTVQKRQSTSSGIR